jgi:histidine ammonia-lyase
VEIELNGVGDNPIFFAETEQQISGANFQGSPVSVPMDMAGYSLTMICVLSERRMNRLNNPALSAGLPPFLSTNPGMMSGCMLSQYTADSMIVEQRILSAPASIQSIPAAADQEDFVSMGMNTALKNTKILDDAYGIIGIEMMVAAQALDLRAKLEEGKYAYGHGVRTAHEEVRKHVQFLDIDRPLHKDHNKMKELLRNLDVLSAVEKAVGPLPLPRGRPSTAAPALVLPRKTDEATAKSNAAEGSRGRSRSRSRGEPSRVSPEKP